MSTRATEAPVLASQGGVARGAQVQGKRTQQAELGKIASAGFARILGDQVAKSTPQARPIAKTGQGFVPHEVPTSPPHAPTQSLREPLPHTTSTPQVLPHSTPSLAADSRFTVRSENPARPTLAPHSESRSLSLPLSIRMDGQPMAAGNTTPAKSTGTQGPAQLPAHHVESPLPQPVPTPEVSRAHHVITHQGQDFASGAGLAQAAVRLSHAPSPVLTSAPMREQIPAQSSPSNTAPNLPVQTGNTTLHVQPAATDNSPRFSTKAHEATAPAAPIPGQATVHAPVPSDKTTPHVKSSAGDNTMRPPSPSLPVLQPAGAPTHFAVPAAVDKSVELSTPPAHTMQQPDFQSMAKPTQRHTVERTVDATAPAMAPTLVARSTAQPPAPKPSDLNKDVTQVVLAPLAQELPRPIPATAPRTTTPALRPSGSANLPPNTPPAPTQKESAPVQNHQDAGHPTVTHAVPTQEQKPQKRPGSTQTPVLAQGASPSIPQPIPATIATESLAPQVARHPEPISPPETAHSIAAAKASPKAAAVRPASGHARVVEDAKPADSTSDVPMPESSATRAMTSGEHTARATANKPATASPEPAATMPAPAPGHAGNKNAVHAETLASKQRPHVDDKKESDETTTAPAGAPQASLRTSHASPSAPLEVNAPKPEVPPSAEHRSTAAGSSQSSSPQSTAGQPNSAQEQLHPAIPTTANGPALFVPPTTLLSSTGDAGVRATPAPSPVAVETAGLVDRAIHDPGLSVNVMPHSAHLSITGDAGDLSLHVRVRDGSADVNVSGTMAPLFDSKAPEMRTALAGEGLQLGSFATDQRNSSQGHQGQPENATRTTAPHPLPPPRRSNTATPEVQIAADRRIHVTA